jgi:hypothetical protein
MIRGTRRDRAPLAVAAWLSALVWLALGLTLAPGARAQDELDDEMGSEDASEAAPSAGEADEPQGETESESDEAAGDDADSDVAEPDPELASEELDEAQPSAGSTERAIALYVASGLGFGTVSFERPTEAGIQALEETPFAAAELLVRVLAWPGRRFSLETMLAYQSSLGLRLQLAPLFGLPERVNARVERGELSVAPVLRFGDGSGPLAIAVPIGFAFQ